MGFGLAPVFASLINLATSAISTLWRPLVVPVAKNILHRLGSYLNDGSDIPTSCPGSICIAQSPGANDVASTPIFSVDGRLSLRDFQPDLSESTPDLQEIGYGWTSTASTFTPLIGAWEASSSSPSVTLPPNSLTQKDILNISGASGRLFLCIRYQTTELGKGVFAPSFLWSSRTLTPIHSHKTLLGTELFFLFDLNGSGVFRASVPICWTSGSELAYADLSLNLLSS